MANRLFTFGCSYTNYPWLTWADLLSFNLPDYEYINCGWCGISNEVINYTMILANQKYKFTPDDIICVVWTTWDREDRFKNDNWTAQGCIHSGPENKVGIVWSSEHEIITNVMAMHSANNLFDISFNGIISMYDQPDSLMELELHDRLLLNDFLGKSSEHFASFHDPIDYSSPAREKIDLITLHDGHPNPRQHLNYVTKEIIPKLGIDIDYRQTLAYIERFEESMLQILADHDDSWNDISRGAVSKSVEKIYGFDRDMFALLWNQPINILMNQVQTVIQ